MLLGDFPLISGLWRSQRIISSDTKGSNRFVASLLSLSWLSFHCLHRGKEARIRISSYFRMRAVATSRRGNVLHSWMAPEVFCVLCSEKSSTNEVIIQLKMWSMLPDISLLREDKQHTISGWACGEADFLLPQHSNGWQISLVLCGLFLSGFGNILEIACDYSFILKRNCCSR